MINKTAKTISYIAAVVAAVVLLQTLFFKFTAHPDSVYIFTQLGMEPWGRIAVGIMELVTGILLLYPATTRYGGVLGLGVISGAVFFHLFVLGINVQNDGGLLFTLAVTVFVSTALVVALNYKLLRCDVLRLLKKPAVSAS
jgi:hypothetical protein